MPSAALVIVIIKPNHIMQTSLIKWFFSIILGTLWCWIKPTLPFAAICLFAVVLDCITAWRLNRRVSLAYPGSGADGKFKSIHAFKMISDLLIVFGCIILAYHVDRVLFPYQTFYLGQLVSAIFCFVEFWSILENESSCSTKSWARLLQRYLVDKTERHLHLSLPDYHSPSANSDPSGQAVPSGHAGSPTPSTTVAPLTPLFSDPDFLSSVIPNFRVSELPRTSRPIHSLILHCTATPEGKDYSVSTIRKWHLARGFSDIGYHYVIYRDGTIHPGRDINKTGAHCQGHNTGSIGIVYVGGLAIDGKTPKDTRTESQRQALLSLVHILLTQYSLPLSSVHCHNEFSHKACPSFSITTFRQEYSQAYPT